MSYRGGKFYQHDNAACLGRCRTEVLCEQTHDIPMLATLYETSMPPWPVERVTADSNPVRFTFAEDER